jgi:carbamate kinase
MKRILIALGGNAIIKPEEKGTFEGQRKNIEIACEQITQIAEKGYELAITHGNGPQVGNLAIQQEHAAKQIPQQPLFVLGAMTQGQLGYMIQQSLMNTFSGHQPKQVITLVTQTVVDESDPDFTDPSKPVGPFYEKAVAKKLAKENGWKVKKVLPKGNKTWRRVVPSPEPLQILEAKAIKTLIDNNVIVIASGGGGIPTVRNDLGDLTGVEAVIDKDKAGAKLAEEIEAEIFLILTDIEYVMKNYGKMDESPITKLTIKEASRLIEAGHFGAGSMKPKVEACVDFLESGGRLAIITSLEKAVEGLEGRTGTYIVQD